MSSDMCNSIIEYINSKIDKEKMICDGMPWHNNDTIQYSDVDNSDIKFLLDSQRFVISQLVYDQFKEIVFPHFTDLVVWRKSMSMDIHKDNGYDESDADISTRKYSAVLYLNDNYSGGETFIKRQDKEDYISIPKQGSLLIFKSNEECLHGVNQVTDGTRYTLASWYTIDYRHFEFYTKE